MARVSFENMPVDGPRDPRSTSRIVNQAMNGKLNAVIDFTIPVGSLPYTLKDIRISPQSYIELMPLNGAAILGELFFLPGDGELVLDEVDQEFRFATAQVSEPSDTIVLSGVAFTQLPYSVKDFDVNWLVEGEPGSAFDRITSVITGYCTGWFTLNGVTSGNNPTVDAGIGHYTSGGSLRERAEITFVGQGNISVFNMSSYQIFKNQVDPGDYFALEAQYAGSFLDYKCLWGLNNESAVEGTLNLIEALKFRALIIG